MPAHPEQHFRWTFDLAASPEALWPLVSNTDRFNRDCGYPPVTRVPADDGARVRLTPPTSAAPEARGSATPPEKAEPDSDASNAATQRLRARVMGLTIEWDERAFEWVAPQHFAVERTYFSGPVTRMVVRCELQPRAGGGTTLVYDMRLTPSSVLGRMALPFSIGRRARTVTERVFRQYDEFAMRGLSASQLAKKPRLADGAMGRIEMAARVLTVEAAQPVELVDRLVQFISNADDFAATRIRPYALADNWRAPRRDVLHLCLHATRAGVLDFSWDLVCPHCRGAKVTTPTLSGVRPQAHCDSCQIDFTANFDQSVELTFTPNAAVRSVTRADYCVGGPQVTPHIVAQQQLAAGAKLTIPLALPAGRYRVRAGGVAEQQAFRIEPDGASAIQVLVGASLTDARAPTSGAPTVEPTLAPSGELTITNRSARDLLVMVEHLAWTDQATTAAEVTSLQLFRDLFSQEVLRAGEQISVGAMTVVFTDLKNSTQLYQEIGDAPAFGRVLTHFEILKAAVAAENGCIVKTMGDAIMAVFPRPVAAVRAMAHAQRWLAAPQEFALPAGVTVPPSSLQPLALKAGIHSGPCLAINQNERLDYFGTTVNTTARLCALCTGADMVLSQRVRADAEVDALLSDRSDGSAAFRTGTEQVKLKGFGDATFEVWRVNQLRP